MGTATNAAASDPNDEPGSKIGDLVRRITDDVKTIAANQIELAKIELGRTASRIVLDTAVVLFGAIIALIGIGLLSITAVVALEPVIPALWLRLLIMAAVYIAIGGAIVLAYVKKIQIDVKPDFDLPAREAQQTVEAIKEGLRG